MKCTARRGAAALCAAVALGCNDGTSPSANIVAEVDAGPGGADAEPPERRRLCDGSSEVRLAVAYQLTTRSFPPLISLLADPGFEFLYVAGDCRFWVKRPGGMSDQYVHWRPYREGTLTVDQENALHTAVAYDDVTAVQGCGGVRPEDAAQLTVWDGEEWIVCRGSFVGPPSWPIREQIYAIGTDLDGPVRIQVKRERIADDAFIYDWPLDSPIEDYVVEYYDAQSFRVDDRDSVSRLRRLRDMALLDAAGAPGYFSGAIAIAPSGTYVPERDEAYMLIMRDELPFTDSSGKWEP